MSKQTSVEWLAQQLLNAEPNVLEWQKYLLQAKEIHKQEIMDSWDYGTEEGIKRTNNSYYNSMRNSETYYNETYQSVDTNEMVDVPQQNDVKGGELATFKNDVREEELHELEVLRNKIKREIGEREPQSKFGSGYKQALIDVEGMIMDMLVVPCFPQQNDVKGGELATFNQVPDVRNMVEDDVEKLAEEMYGKGKVPDYEEGFIDGYNKAKETLYTEEQVREAIDMARSQKGYASYEYTENEIIQSLKQPKQ